MHTSESGRVPARPVNPDVLDRVLPLLPPRSDASGHESLATGLNPGAIRGSEEPPTLPSTHAQSRLQDLINRFESRSPVQHATRGWVTPHRGQDTLSLCSRTNVSVTSLAEQVSVASGAAASVAGLGLALNEGETPGDLLRTAAVELYDFDPPRAGSLGETDGRVDRGWTPVQATLFTHVLVLSYRPSPGEEASFLVLELAKIISLRHTKIVAVPPVAPGRRRHPLEILMTEGSAIVSFESAQERLKFSMDLEYVPPLAFSRRCSD